MEIFFFFFLIATLLFIWLKSLMTATVSGGVGPSIKAGQLHCILPIILQSKYFKKLDHPFSSAISFQSTRQLLPKDDFKTNACKFQWFPSCSPSPHFQQLDNQDQHTGHWRTGFLEVVGGILILGDVVFSSLLRRINGIWRNTCLDSGSKECDHRTKPARKKWRERQKRPEKVFLHGLCRNANSLPLSQQLCVLFVCIPKGLQSS